MEKRPAEATLFRNGRRELCPHAHRRELCPHAHRGRVLLAYIQDVADLHGPRWLNNSWSTMNLHLGLAFERKPNCTNMHWMFTCLFQASSFLIGYWIYFFISQPNETAPCSEFWKLVFSISQIILLGIGWLHCKEWSVLCYASQFLSNESVTAVF